MSHWGTNIRLFCVVILVGSCVAQFDFLDGSGSGSEQTEGTLGDWLESYNGTVVPKKNPYSGFEGLGASIRNIIPRPVLSLDIDSIDFAQLQPYAIKVGSAAGAGFVLAILSLITTIVYIPIRLCCACCAKKKKPQLVVKAKTHTFILFIILISAAVACLVALAAGASGNFGFTSVMTGLVGDVNGAAGTLQNTMQSITDFIADLPTTLSDFIHSLTSLLSVIPMIFHQAEDLTNSLQTLSDSLVVLDNDLSALPEPARPQALSNEVSELVSSSNATAAESRSVVQNAKSGDLAQYTNGSFFDNFDASGVTGDISRTFDSLTNTIDTYATYGSTYSAMALGYDRYRLAAVNVMYALPLIALVLVGIAALTKQGWLFHATVTLSFFLLFLAFLLGSVEFVIAVILGDACTALKEFEIPGSIYSILSECNENASLVDIMGLGSMLSSPDILDTGTLGNLSGLISNGYNGTVVDSFVNRSESLSAFSNVTDSVDLVVNASHQARTAFFALQNSIDNVTTTLGPQIESLVNGFIQNLADTIRNFARCGFVSDTFMSVHTHICSELVASLDVQFVCCFVLGFATIPLIVVENQLIKIYKQKQEDKKKKSVSGGAAEDEEETAGDPSINSYRENVVHPTDCEPQSVSAISRSSTNEENKEEKPEISNK